MTIDDIIERCLVDLARLGDCHLAHQIIVNRIATWLELAN